MSDNKGKNLWAPWRIEYILSPKDGECFLCGREKENSKKVDDYMIVYRGKNAFVMLNAYPYNSGHLLIAPYLHIGNLSNLPKDALYEISDLTVFSKEVLENIMKPDGFNMGYNFGIVAGAGCAEHLHFHIVPRWNGDVNFMPVIGEVKVIPQSLRDTAEIIRDGFSRKNV